MAHIGIRCFVKKPISTFCMRSILFYLVLKLYRKKKLAGIGLESDLSLKTYKEKKNLIKRMN